MDLKNISVIFVMIMACLTCGANGELDSNETTTSNTTNSPAQPITSVSSATLAPTQTSVTNSTELCVIIEISLNFDASFKTVDNQTISKPCNIIIDKENKGKKVTRSCAGPDQSLTMSWEQNSSYIRFQFRNSSTDKTYMLSQIDLVVNVNAEFKSSNATSANQLLNMTYISEEKSQFKAPIGKSYESNDVVHLQFTNLGDDSKKTVDVAISKVYMEAFRQGNKVENASSNITMKTGSSNVTMETSSSNVTVEMRSSDVTNETGSSNAIIIAVSVIAAVIVLSAIAFIIYRRRAQGQCIFGASPRE